jgi:hypothetical protein
MRVPRQLPAELSIRRTGTAGGPHLLCRGCSRIAVCSGARSAGGQERPMESASASRETCRTWARRAAPGWRRLLRTRDRRGRPKPVARNRTPSAPGHKPRRAASPTLGHTSATGRHRSAPRREIGTSAGASAFSHDAAHSLPVSRRISGLPTRFSSHDVPPIGMNRFAT